MLLSVHETESACSYSLICAEGKWTAQGERPPVGLHCAVGDRGHKGQIQGA